MPVFAFATPFGRSTLTYDREGVHAVNVGSKRKADAGPHPASMRKLAVDVTRALSGKPVKFSKVKLALADVPAFHADVYRTLQRLPWGVTITYGELAAKAGRPGAARAVGRAMAECRWSIVVPCHRVVLSGGRLGGFGGPGGQQLKRRLLGLEGNSLR